MKHAHCLFSRSLKCLPLWLGGCPLRTFCPIVLLPIDDSTFALDHIQDVAQGQISTSPKDGPPAVHKRDRDDHPLKHPSARLRPTKRAALQNIFVLIFVFIVLVLFLHHPGLVSLFSIDVRLVKRVNQVRLQLPRPVRARCVIARACRPRIHHRLSHCLPYRDPEPNLLVHCNQRTDGVVEQARR